MFAADDHGVPRLPLVYRATEGARGGGVLEHARHYRCGEARQIDEGHDRDIGMKRVETGAQRLAHPDGVRGSLDDLDSGSNDVTRQRIGEAVRDDRDHMLHPSALEGGDSECEPAATGVIDREHLGTPEPRASAGGEDES